MPDVEWANLRAPELRDLAATDAIVLVPVGSVEQHGPHLPVKVDALLSGEIALRAARSASARAPVVVTPCLWAGLAEHHMTLGGTITLDFSTFSALVGCVVRSLVRQGFRRILLLNGHGGNENALRVITGELTTELSIPLVACSYWDISKEPFAEILERQVTVRHAGEAETSMLLALNPELVDRTKLSEAKGPSSPELEDLVGAGAYRWRSLASRTKSGVIGEAESATAEKGEALLNAASRKLAELIATDALWATPI